MSWNTFSHTRGILWQWAESIHEALDCNLYELKSIELQSLYQSSPVVAILCSPEFIEQATCESLMSYVVCDYVVQKTIMAIFLSCTRKCVRFYTWLLYLTSKSAILILLFIASVKSKLIGSIGSMLGSWDLKMMFITFLSFLFLFLINVFMFLLNPS